jgi:MFS transporter, DHA3 family, macrolide efflux protein
MRKLTVLLAGTMVSMLGSAFTGFALGVWVFQRTGSATEYGATLVLNLLPGLLFAPVAGALVDRLSRRGILVLSDAVNAVTILTVAILYTAGVLEVWQIFIAVGIQSLVRALQLPAMNSVIVLMAPKEQVGRANGMMLLAQALGGTAGMAAAGFLLLAIGLNGVLLVDCATFVFDAVILLLIAIPRPARSAAGSGDADEGRLLGEIRQGWRYLAARRGLVSLILFYAALNLTVGYADALLTPVVLSFASPKALGLVLALLGVGMVLGSVALTAWGGPRRRIYGLAGFALPLGFFLCLGALRPSIPLIMIAALGFTFCFTIVDGTSRSVIQLEIEPDMQGRAFATFGMVASAVMCLAYATAGPLADHVFEPLLLKGGSLAGTVGTVMAVGKGRGMALLVGLIGLFAILTAVVGYLQPSLRTLPDRPSGERGAKEAEPAIAPFPIPAAEAMAVPVPDGLEGEVPDRR